MRTGIFINVAVLVAVCIFPSAVFADEVIAKGQAPEGIQCEPVPCDFTVVPPECKGKTDSAFEDCLKNYCINDAKKKPEDRNPLCSKKIRKKETQANSIGIGEVGGLVGKGLSGGAKMGLDSLNAVNGGDSKGKNHKVEGDKNGDKGFVGPQTESEAADFAAKATAEGAESATSIMAR